MAMQVTLAISSVTTWQVIELTELVFTLSSEITVLTSKVESKRPTIQELSSRTLSLDSSLATVASNMLSITREDQQAEAADWTTYAITARTVLCPSKICKKCTHITMCSNKPNQLFYTTLLRSINSNLFIYWSDIELNYPNGYKWS